MTFLMYAHGPGPWGHGRLRHHLYSRESHPLVGKKGQQTGKGRALQQAMVRIHEGPEGPGVMSLVSPRRWGKAQGSGGACAGCKERMGVRQARE